MVPEPTVRQLRHFLSLAEHFHFGKAAEACSITQSSLSSSIKELETVLGAALFERTKRTVVLTPLGRRTIDAARDVIGKLEDLTDMVRATGQPLAGELHLGVIPTIGSFLLPRVIPGLRDAYPDMKLYLREEPTQALLRRLKEGELDLVLMALPYEIESLELLEFANDPFMVVFPRGHKFATFETMTPGRMSDEALLVLEQGNCLTDQTLAMGGLNNQGLVERFHATSLHTLVQMVDNGLGISVLPKMAVDAGILRGLKLDFRPFSSPKAFRRIALAWRNTSKRADEFRLLGSFLRDELGTPVSGA